MAKKKSTKKKSSTKKTSTCCDMKFENMCNEACNSGGCAYFLGFLGAAVYYISTATGFWMGVWGVIKALVWPAFLVFEALKFLGM